MKNRKHASTSKRIFATIIDYFVFTLTFFIYALYFGEETIDGYTVTGIMVFPIIIFWFCYFIAVEGFYQATLGHQLFNITVRQENNKSIDIGHSFKRRILDIIDLSMFGIPALIAISNSKKRQRLGDMYAKTIVVEDTYVEA
ncbi:MAG: putative RDD family membrane protein YckC [Halioglobus sp.]